MSAAHASARRFCTFRLAGCDYAVELAEVQEILRGRPWTRVPLAPPAVCGLMNLRGQIVTVIDLGALLDGRPSRLSGSAPAGFVLVLAGARAGTGLAVEEVGEVVEWDARELEPPPATLSRTARPRVRGVHVSAAAVVTVLRLDALLDAEEAPSAG